MGELYNTCKFRAVLALAREANGYTFGRLPSALLGTGSAGLDRKAPWFQTLDSAGVGVNGDALELVAPVADDGIIGTDQPADLRPLVVACADAAGHSQAPLLTQPGGQSFLNSAEVGAQGLDVTGQAFLDVAAAELDQVGPTSGRGVTNVGRQQAEAMACAFTR